MTYLQQSLAIQQHGGAIRDSVQYRNTFAYKMNRFRRAGSAWATVYLIAKRISHAQALKALADLAPMLGIPEGPEGWETLAQQMQSVAEESPDSMIKLSAIRCQTDHRGDSTQFGDF